MLKMQMLEDDEDFVKTNAISPTVEESRQRHTSDGRPAWMRTLLTSTRGWLSLMPKVKNDTNNQERTPSARNVLSVLGTLTFKDK